MVHVALVCLKHTQCYVSIFNIGKTEFWTNSAEKEHRIDKCRELLKSYKKVIQMMASKAPTVPLLRNLAVSN